jgi:alkylhydroperoxidase family enzyme
MAWIELVEPDDAEGKLQELYDRAAKATGGRVGPMIRAGSRNPDALDGRMRMNRALMYGRSSSLSRAEREMVAVATSVENGCHF